jgi:hypothetical protein
LDALGIPRPRNFTDFAEDTERTEFASILSEAVNSRIGVNFSRRKVEMAGLFEISD